MLLEGHRIGCLGGGAMGEALVAGLLRGNLVAPVEVFVSDVDPKRRDYLHQKMRVNTSGDNVAVVKTADIIILAVKPYVIIPLLREIAPAARREHTFISIAAGVTLDQLQACFADDQIPVIRAIPNTPCLVGEGATAISAGQYADAENMEKARTIFAAAGRVVDVPENLLDVVTGLSSSGPAYMYLLLEGFIDGAVRLGLPRDMARVLIAQTMLGAAKMIFETGEHPGKLKDMVTTPGGTTMAGLFTLEEGGVRALMMKAVAEAARRAGEMAEIK